jgi:hypothetical protein
MLNQRYQKDAFQKEIKSKIAEPSLKLQEN